MTDPLRLVLWDVDGTLQDARGSLFPGIRPVLDQLQEQGVLMGLVTGMGRRGVADFIECHGLAGFFITIGSADDGPGKPSPFMVQRAVSETGVERKNTVVIGDTSFDMIMARSAGVSTIGAAWGNYTVSGLWQSGADMVVAEPADVPACVGMLTDGGRG